MRDCLVCKSPACVDDEGFCSVEGKVTAVRIGPLGAGRKPLRVWIHGSASVPPFSRRSDRAAGAVTGP